MSDNRNNRRGGSILSMLATLFLICCLGVAVFAVVGYAAGWVNFQHDEQQQKATIEVETGEVKKAAEEAVEQGKKMVDEAGESIQEMTDFDDDRPGDQPTSSPTDELDVDVEVEQPQAER